MKRLIAQTTLLLSLSLSPLSAEKPNILFFAFDDLRPLIKTYGEPEPITPHLDALAADGIRFDRNYVAYPLCKPSRATMLNGIRFDGQPIGGKWPSHTDLIKTQETWPSVLRNAGYWTAARGKVYHSGVPGTDKDAWDIAGKKGGANTKKIVAAIVDHGGREDHVKQYLDTGNGPAALAYFATEGPENLLNDGQTCDDVISYLKTERDPNKPFAIACGFLRPHMPWAAPKKYFDLYPEDAGQLAQLPEGREKIVDPEEVSAKNNNERWNEGVDDQTAQKLIRGYMACTSYVDAQMGKVIQALKDEGLYDNTIIIAWGDHGYHLTDHGLWRKNTAYHISMRSPLIIKAPGVKGGQSSQHIVDNTDLYPTILDLAGVATPSTIQLHGNSFAPLLNNSTTPNPDWDNITYTCAKGRYGLITDRYRFTLSEETGPSLYDLKEDPHEWNNLGNDPQHQNLIADFKQKLTTVPWNSPDGKPTASTKPSNEEPKQEWDWFTTLDKNKDKQVTETEWLNRAKSKAEKDQKKGNGKPYNEAQAKKAFTRIDTNADGKITREELEKK